MNQQTEPVSGPSCTITDLREPGPSMHEVLFHQSAQIVVLIKALAQYETKEQIQALVGTASPAGSMKDSAVNFVEDILTPRYCPIKK